ncbi:Carbonyl reductase [NADPH] 1 [Papilio machaon]|uniref:Carbonyl reductase [NADPH] 1 n=1 Tax=Papilio machaon TaxID=76193 RepID=A0A194REE5_PAPMA|nr:Carbonyl reductase [NADPH] 1 [Papilio machaon]
MSANNENNMSDKVAVVTGSNKGLGYIIVRDLCRRGVGVVYLTARDERRGLDAVEALKKEGLNPVFHQLDVTDKESVKRFAQHLKEKHGGIDILINNAAVITNDFNKTTFEDSVNVLNANYFSILTIQEYIFPVLKDNARVLNISSDAGHISNLENPYWIKRLTSEDLKLEDINDFVNWFLDSVKNGTLKEDDFVETGILAYRISKVALSALTRVQQKQVGRGISINSLHPGFIKTNMTKNSGFLELDDAGIAPVYFVLDADQSLKGKYLWFDKTEKEWTDHKLKIHSRMDIFMEHLKMNNKDYV